MFILILQQQQSLSLNNIYILLTDNAKTLEQFNPQDVFLFYMILFSSVLEIYYYCVIHEIFI